MSEEEHQSDATADIAHAMLSYLANGTCGDCLQSLTDYGGKHGDHYDAMLMEFFEQVADEIIRRSDEKHDPLYTRDDLLKVLQER